METECKLGLNWNRYVHSFRRKKTAMRDICGSIFCIHSFFVLFVLSSVSKPTCNFLRFISHVSCFPCVLRLSLFVNYVRWSDLSCCEAFQGWYLQPAFAYCHFFLAVLDSTDYLADFAIVLSETSRFHILHRMTMGGNSGFPPKDVYLPLSGSNVSNFINHLIHVASADKMLNEVPPSPTGASF